MASVAKGCSVEGCDRKSVAKGYCSTHHRQLRRGSTPGKIRPRVMSYLGCRFPECERPHHGHGYCSKHVRLKTKFHLSDEAIKRLYLDPRCQICGLEESDSKSLDIDHDHLCCPKGSGCDNCVRGLLCRSCNQAIGIMNEDVERLASAIHYIMTNRQT